MAGSEKNTIGHTTEFTNDPPLSSLDEFWYDTNSTTSGSRSTIPTMSDIVTICSTPFRNMKQGFTKMSYQTIFKDKDKTD